jgi:PBP1b-binding outer membrane lipoprotein LpoB
MPASPVVIGNNIVVVCPTEEKTLDADDLAPAMNYFVDEMRNRTETALSVILLSDKNKKFDNRFAATYDKYFRTE